MATVPTTPSSELLLRAQHVRELIRDAHGGFAPDYVARILRERNVEPADGEAQELVILFNGLTTTARERLHDAGIEPLPADRQPQRRLPKRERDSAANMTVLQAALAMALLAARDQDAALAAVEEGLAWGRATGEPRHQHLLWKICAEIHTRDGRTEISDEAMLQEIAVARATNDPRLITSAIGHRISSLISWLKIDEAEKLNQEVFALLETMPQEDRHPEYAFALSNSARICQARHQYPEAIQTLREALRWADGAVFPLTRSSVLAQLGAIYLELAQYRQCIECQHEVVQLAGVLGSDMIRGWGYIRLADAHMWLKEYDRAGELLDTADTFVASFHTELRMLFASRRAKLFIALGEWEKAAEICRWILECIADVRMPIRTLTCYVTLGEVEEHYERWEQSEIYFREAVATAEREFPQRAWPPKVSLAAVLIKQGRHDEAAALLDEITSATGAHPSNLARALRLRATIAETRGDLRTVLELEREAFAIERELLERESEQSLRNARIIAQTDLLEREADLERERRRRVERELADAVVELGDRKRTVENVEERLRLALERSTSDTQRTVTTALREALVSLRSGAQAHERPLHYLADVDEEFYQRLRIRFPGLTRKQERLCGLLRAGLASKEIATLMELEPEGLKAQRKRLRKRLGLEQEDRLEQFLAEL